MSANPNFAVERTANFNEDEVKGKSTKEKYNNTLTDELIFGVCYPIGSKKDEVINAIKARIKEYGYEAKVIKLSDYINEYCESSFKSVPGETDAYNELMHKIKGGNELRTKYSSNSILVDIAIKDINLKRLSRHQKNPEIAPKDIEIKSERICYIIDSLKNKEELELLRSIYRSIFYLISIFSPDDERRKVLRAKKLADPEIDKIINVDEYENDKHGQDVRNTFIDADLFLRVSESNSISIEDRIERFLHIVFNSSIVTPNQNERAMYAAKSAAGNSSCLSRQVGAAISDGFGNIISTGWNDAPKYGGNLYQETDINDKRCCTLGYCSNDSQKNTLIDDIVEEIRNIPTFKKVLESKEGKSTTVGISENEALLRSAIKKTRVKGLIEFSRSIHAEMHAIIIGSQLNGNKMVGGKLYCTTYPCHNCARHIILAGIKEIYFIEPYKKSLGTTLHDDAITENENEKNKVKILVYDGIAPRRYLEFFTMNEDERKEGGKIISRDLSSYSPKNRLSLQSLPTLEKQSIHNLQEIGFLESDGNKEIKK